MTPETPKPPRTRKPQGAVENTALLTIIADAIVVFVSLVLAFYIRFNLLEQFGTLWSEITVMSYWAVFLIGAIALVIIFGRLHLYESHYILSPRRAFPRISRACLLWLVCYLAALKLLEPELTMLADAQVQLLGNRFDASRLFILVAPCVLLVTLTAWRYLLCKLIWRFSRADKLVENVLFIGWNDNSADAGGIMSKEAGSPMRIVGAVRSPKGDFSAPLPEGMKDYGRYEDLPALLHSGDIDLLLTTDSELDHRHLSETITHCEKAMVGFKLVPTCFRVLLGGLHLERIFGMPLLGISKLPLHSRLNLFLKRVIDFIGGLIGLFLSAPLIALFGILIYLESPGPIFYRQRRVGQRGREFDIIKLRSMKLDSETSTGAVWAVENDPRRLKIGRFLRAWNIDEVPQFWNVVKGEMSLVGPRPERPELIQRFRDEIPHYNARHSIKPGITGWAQVNGLRGNTDLSERIKYDLHYIERWNIFFDFQIMLLTFVKRQNAY